MAKESKTKTTLYIPDDLLAELESDQFGDTLSQVLSDRLRQAFKMGPRERPPASPIEIAELKRKQAEAVMAERKAAAFAGQLVFVDLMTEEVQKGLAVVRRHVEQIPNQISGLTPEQFREAKAAVQDCFAEICEVNDQKLVRQTIERL